MVLGVGGTKLYYDTGLPLVQPAPFLARIKKPPDPCFGYTHPSLNFKTEHTNWGTRGSPSHPISYCTEVHSNIIPSDLFTLKTTATHPLLCARCSTPISIKLGDTMVYTTHTLQICTVTDIHEDTCGPTLYTVRLQDGTKVMATSRALKSVGQVDCSKCSDKISYMSVSDTLELDEPSKIKLRGILTTFPMSAYTGTGLMLSLTQVHPSV